MTDPRPSHPRPSDPRPADARASAAADPHAAEKDQRALEQGLSDFQLGLQRRLESSLRINTLILAVAAVVSLAFAFNALQVLERAFDVEALDRLIRDIAAQSTALKERSDRLTDQIERLAVAVESKATRMENLAGPSGALTEAERQTERLSRDLRRGRGTADTAAAALSSAGQEAQTLADLLAAERALLDAASGEGGALDTVHHESGQLADDVRRERERLLASDLPRLATVADALAQSLDHQRQTLDAWTESERSLSALQRRADQLAAQLTVQEDEAARATRLQGEVLTSLKALNARLKDLESQLAELGGGKKPPATPHADEPPAGP